METVDQLLIQKIISSVDEYRASALHLSVGDPPMLRINDKLVAMPDAPVLSAAFLETVVATWLDDVARKRLTDERHVTFARTFENRRRFKISLFYQQGNISASLSLLPNRIPTLQELALPTTAQALANIDAGLVLICGPFGSGRTTTVASFMEERNRGRQEHIVIIEDPIEFIFEDKQCVIEQREVGRDVLSIADALRFTLDEDVDVVAVAPLETGDAYRAALDVALAGKVVFGVMNANNLLAALTMIVHSFADHDQERIRAELASVLIGFLNQRLVPLRGGGVTLAAEVILTNTALRSVIASGDLLQLENIIATSSDTKIQNLDRAIQYLVDSGKVQPEVAYRYIHPSS